VAHTSVTIPLDARVESLNVAVAAAVLVFAARRTGPSSAPQESTRRG